MWRFSSGGTYETFTLAAVTTGTGLPVIPPCQQHSRHRLGKQFQDRTDDPIGGQQHFDFGLRGQIQNNFAKRPKRASDC
ncbi:hypothetical protein BgiBS90_001601, partial [Biomphalaria glabrata]